MGWRVIGKPISTADNASTKPVVSQRFSFDGLDDDQILEGVGVGIIFLNDVSFSSIGVELWSDENDSPGTLLAESETEYSKDELLINEIHALKFAGFKFAPVPLKRGIKYRIALRMQNYTGDDASHIAWRYSYPDPQYVDGLTLNAAKAATHPLELSIFAAKA